MNPEKDDIEDPDFGGTSTEPYRINQFDLNDLIRDLNLSKNQAELLASRLKGWNLFEKRTTISFYCRQEQDLQRLFFAEGHLMYYTGADSLRSELGDRHDPKE